MGCLNQMLIFIRLKMSNHASRCGVVRQDCFLSHLHHTSPYVLLACYKLVSSSKIHALYFLLWSPPWTLILHIQLAGLDSVLDKECQYAMAVRVLLRSCVCHTSQRQHQVFEVEAEDIHIKVVTFLPWYSLCFHLLQPSSA